MSGSTPFTSAGDRIRWLTVPGAGEPVLYLHGLGCTAAASWLETAVVLGRPGILVELPGHGRSDRPHDFDYTLPAMADAVAAAARAASGTSGAAFDVVSHSLGGSIALVLAERHTALVRRSVLVEPAIDVRPVAPGDLAAEDEGELLAGGWARLLGRELDWRRADVQLTDPVALVRGARALADEHAERLHALLAHPSVPTTLVIGEVREYDDAADFTAGGVRVEHVAGAQHFVMWERPAEFTALLREVLP